MDGLFLYLKHQRVHWVTGVDRIQNAPQKHFPCSISHWPSPNHHETPPKQQELWHISVSLPDLWSVLSATFSLEECCRFLIWSPIDTVKPLALAILGASTKLDVKDLFDPSSGSLYRELKRNSSMFQPGEIHLIQEVTAKSWKALPDMSLTLHGETSPRETALGSMLRGTGVIHSPQALVFLHQQRKS